jgi:hypothetical protein
MTLVDDDYYKKIFVDVVESYHFDNDFVVDIVVVAVVVVVVFEDTDDHLKKMVVVQVIHYRHIVHYNDHHFHVMFE